VTWGGPAGLAVSGTGWPAFDGDRAVSVAVPFFVGADHEDIGVVGFVPVREHVLYALRTPIPTFDQRPRPVGRPAV
jgi:hypothetical protein